MKNKKQHLYVLGLGTIVFCSAAGAAMSDWYRGGSFDGYDRTVRSAVFAELCVNNADGATNVTMSSAWLNGVLTATSAGEPAVVRVYWGPVDAGTAWGTWANAYNFGSITQGHHLSTSVSVSPATTYYYRFYATNAAGEGWASASATFLTPSSPVLDNGPGALPVGARSATLHGNLTAGVSADVYVFWGLSDGGTVKDNWGNTNSLGTLGQTAFFTLAGDAMPGMTYYYRCYGTNVYGDYWTEAFSFATLEDVSGFYGGSYDGYDVITLQAPMTTRDPSVNRLNMFTIY